MFPEIAAACRLAIVFTFKNDRHQPCLVGISGDLHGPFELASPVPAFLSAEQKYSGIDFVYTNE